MLGSHEWWCVNLVADGDEIAEVDIYEIWSHALTSSRMAVSSGKFSHWMGMSEQRAEEV